MTLRGEQPKDSGFTAANRRNPQEAADAGGFPTAGDRAWAKCHCRYPDSHSGYNFTRYTLVRLGKTHGFFGRVVEAGFHQEALRMVAAGWVGASAIDSQVLAIELRDHPTLEERVRIIDALGPATIQPVVAALWAMVAAAEAAGFTTLR